MWESVRVWVVGRVRGIAPPHPPFFPSPRYMDVAEQAVSALALLTREQPRVLLAAATPEAPNPLTALTVYLEWCVMGLSRGGGLAGGGFAVC